MWALALSRWSRISSCTPLLMAIATIRAATPTVTPTTESKVTIEMKRSLRLARRYRAATNSSNDIV